MGAVITRLRRGRKKGKESKKKQKRGKVVVVKKGSLTRSSKRSVRNSRRSLSQRNKNIQRKPLTEVFTNASTDKMTDGSVMVKDKEQQVMDLARTQGNDSQSSKKMSIKRRKSTGTQRRKNERQPHISTKSEDTTGGVQIVDNNIPQRDTKFRASQRSMKGSIRRRKSSRKLKKHLFPSPTVFSQIDAHVIKAGEEVMFFFLII